jgi:hypothetical protein
MFDPFADEEDAEPSPRPPFPSPTTALMLTFGSSLAAFVIAFGLFEEPDVVAFGIGEALGVGGVATLAARRVPEPQAARLGLRGFSPRFIPMLLCLVPLVFLASELDNWGRDLDRHLPTLVPEAALDSGAPQTSAEADGASTAPTAGAEAADVAPDTGAAPAADAAQRATEAADDASSVAPVTGLGADEGAEAATDEASSALLQEPPEGWDLVQIAIVTVGIAPVVEGFLFFGVILQGLVGMLGRRRGLILTGCLYALVHMVGQVGLDAGPAQSIAGLAALILTGAILGQCRLATGSVLAPIVLATGFIGVQLFSWAAPDVLAVPGYNVELDAHTPLSVLLPATAAVAWGWWLLARQPGEVLPPA